MHYEEEEFLWENDKKRCVDIIIENDECNSDKKRKKLDEDNKSNDEEIINNTSYTSKKYNGISEMCNCLGLLYGVGIERNKEEAKKICLEKCKEQNLIAKAIQELYGWECDKDEKKSVDDLKEYVEKEELKENEEMGYVLNLLGESYEKGGEGIDKDLRKSIEYYLKAIEWGNSVAMNNLAIIYQQGISFELNYESCDESSNESSTKSDKSSQDLNDDEKDERYVHSSRSHGFNISISIKKNTRRQNRASSCNSRKRLSNKKKKGKGGRSKKASERRKSGEYSKNKVSPFFIGRLVEEKSSLKKAFILFKKASELGNSDAMCNLALLYQNGTGVERNVDTAIHYFQKSQLLGNDVAMYHLAYIYLKGLGVERNQQLAVNYFEKASELGNSYAMNNLAFMYLQGIGVEKDDYKAFKLYEKSSDLGNVHAMNNLACMYKDGKGVEKNSDKFFQLLQKSSDHGNHKATNNLACIYLQGTLVEKNIEKAIQLFEKSSDSGYREATKNLALIFENFEVNLDKAAFYFYKLFHSESDLEKKETFREKLFEIISFQKTTWKKEYHCLWRASDCLDDQIFALLLVSKFRQDSSLKHTGYLVKGVMMNIIKFLCHFHQTKSN